MTTLYVDNIAPNLQSKISAPNLQLPSGSVVQVVEASNSTQIVTTSSSFVTANLSASITPSSTTSKILIIVAYQGGPVDNGAADAYAAFAITKDSGSSFLNKAGIRGYDYGGSGSIVFCGNILTYYDAPSTTSSLTYAVYHRLHSGDSLYNNTLGPGSDQNASTITLMEIAG